MHNTTTSPTHGAEGADRLTPRARTFLWRHRGRVSVRVSNRGVNARLCADLEAWGWLDLESFRGGCATYTVVAVPTPEPRVAPDPTSGTGGGNIPTGAHAGAKVRTMSAKRAEDAERIAHDHPPYEDCGPSCLHDANKPAAGPAAFTRPWQVGDVVTLADRAGTYRIMRTVDEMVRVENQFGYMWLDVRDPALRHAPTPAPADAPSSRGPYRVGDRVHRCGTVAYVGSSGLLVVVWDDDTAGDVRPDAVRPEGT